MYEKIILKKTPEISLFIPTKIMHIKEIELKIIWAFPKFVHDIWDAKMPKKRLVERFWSIWELAINTIPNRQKSPPTTKGAPLCHW